MAFEVAGARLEIFHFSTRKHSVVAALVVVGVHVKVYRPVAHIGPAFVENGLGHFYLFNDVACGGRFNGRRQGTQTAHDFSKVDRVALHNFHGLDFLQTRFLGNFIFAYIGIAFQVTGIGDVAHIAHLVAKVL